ncbi:MAG: 5'/3'-nucleotidase SurE [Dehalococcoidales bacterium]
MKILVTNDDGVHAEGLWALVSELAKSAQVTVVAPDGERSAIGTAVTLFQPLHAVETQSPVAAVRTWAVDGSPSDCVILGLGKLIQDKVDMVVSGINPNLNLGEDVHISGTVGAALQGYFRGLPALAISAPPESRTGLESAARVAALLAARMAGPTPHKIFLNVNVPDGPLSGVAGVKITRLARSSHINTVEEGDDGQRKQYRLVRARLTNTGDNTDIQAIEQGYISMTALYTSFLDKPPQRLLYRLCSELDHELIKNRKSG